MGGVDVLALQQALKDLGFFPAHVTMVPYFGQTTFASVVAYQKARGIPSTGFVGALTRAALNAR